MTNSNDKNDDPLVTLGMNLSRSCRYLYDHQGVSLKELIWILHGILGQVLSWEPRKDPKAKDHDSDFDIGDL